MIESSAGYQTAIVADARRILIEAIIDIVDPDLTYGAAACDSRADYSLDGQLHDKIFTLTPYATLEKNRWALDGSFHMLPDSSDAITGQAGFAGGALSGADGSFAAPAWVELRFSNVSILQACSVYFPTADYDGVPVDFTVEVRQGGTSYYTRTFTGNTEDHVSLDGFTVHNPDAIRVTVTKWSLPYRRMRLAEIVPGVYERWDEDIIAELNIQHQGNFACLALPYGTCTLKMDNLDRRFEPRSKNGLFQSIEERQGVDVKLGVRLADGTDEYRRVGVFYQYSGGWKTGDNGLTMQWYLVDIIGLLADRDYLVPAALPTTLEGWIASLTAQLGKNFEKLYSVDPDYADLPVTANSADDVTGKTCGDILRFACMAALTWPRADAETGKLTVEPFWNQGNRLDLDNLSSYPVMRANDDLAAITFKLYDEAKTEYVVSGNSTASSATVSVDNPFLHTKEDALSAARLILSSYGGNQLETTGRGDMSSEIGDVDTVWLNESSATTARRMHQSFDFTGGVLQGCRSVLLQADGSFLFQSRAVLTEGGSWTAPAGVSKLRLILVGRGGDGTDGTDGTWGMAGEDGVEGAGGKVWAGTVDINPEQTFSVAIGQDASFGQYSSADGQLFPLGYTDVASGDSFARSGVEAPLPGTGDGGARGIGGVKGNRHYETVSGTDKDGNHWTTTYEVVDNYPGKGTEGVSGVPGCVVVYWDKEGA